MMQEPEAPKSSSENTKTFLEKLKLQPTSEESTYQDWVKREFWSIDQFAALVAGLTPEAFKNGSKGEAKITDTSFQKRSDHANEVFGHFLKDIDNDPSMLKTAFPIDKSIALSAWRFIKWAAEHDVRIHQRFFDALSFELKEQFVEFLPINSALRTANIHSRAFHKAYYQKHAQELLEKDPNLTPAEIWKHPHMQNVQRHIRDLGGNYEKRTITESWLPELNERPRGRPKKPKTS